MRRMNYPRFDKPTYVGTFHEKDSGFVLDQTKGFFPDGDPEPGVYVAVIDNDDSNNYTVLCSFSTTTTTNACWYGAMWDDMARFWYIPGDGAILGAGPTGAIKEGATIELYKIS